MNLYSVIDQNIGAENVRTIIECGAGECEDTLRFANHFPKATIYSFECNPTTLPQCRASISGRDNIHLIEKAVADRDGVIPFYPINIHASFIGHKAGNPRASSLFRASGKYPLERLVQDEITVRATRLSTFMRRRHIQAVDLLWMDVQGAELLALRGLGKRIYDVRFIHLEVEFMEIYAAQPLYPDVDKYLKEHGFSNLGFTEANKYFGSAIYINCGGG